MAIIATRLNSDGTLLINGNLDEVTYNGSTSTSVVKQQPDSISIQGIFDEVTFNTTNPTIKNLFTFSQDFTQNWLFQQASTSLSVTSTIELAPDGTNTASKISVNNTSSSFYSFYRGYPCLSNTNYSYSIFVKKAEVSQTGLTVFTTANNSISFNLDTGLQTSTSIGDNLLTINTSTITKVGNDWFRINLGFSRSIAGTFQFKVDLLSGFSTIGNGLNVWGAQLEQSLTPTIYQGIANTGTLVTSSIARKIDNQGNYYLKNQFDEFTGAPVVDPSLVFWLDAAQPISYSGAGTEWKNLIGSINTGTLIGNPIFANNEGGGSIQFYGTETYVSVVGYKGITGTAARTVNLWFKSTVTNTPQRLIAWGYAAGFTTGDYGKKYCIRSNSVSPYSLRFEFSGGQIFGTGTSITIVDGKWHMLTVVNPENSYINQTSLYIDGIKLTDLGTDTTSTFSSVLVNTSATFDVSIGASIPDEDFSGYNGDRAQGYISTVAIYSKALNDDEVQQNFNALRRRYNI